MIQSALIQIAPDYRFACNVLVDCDTIMNVKLRYFGKQKKIMKAQFGIVKEAFSLYGSVYPVPPKNKPLMELRKCTNENNL